MTPTRRPGPTPGVRLLVTIAVGFVPWLVVRSSDTWGVVVAAGLVGRGPLQVTPIWTYLMDLTRGLPPSLAAWPVAALLWLGAVASAASGAASDREDRRLSGGLLVLAGASLLPLASAVGRPSGVLAVPVGTVALWTVAWWAHRDALRRVVGAGGTGAGG